LINTGGENIDGARNLEGDDEKLMKTVVLFTVYICQPSLFFIPRGDSFLHIGKSVVDPCKELLIVHCPDSVVLVVSPAARPQPPWHHVLQHPRRAVARVQLREQIDNNDIIHAARHGVGADEVSCN